MESLESDGPAPAPIDASRDASAMGDGVDSSYPRRSGFKVMAVVLAMLGLVLAASAGQALVFYVGLFGSTFGAHSPSTTGLVAGARATAAPRVAAASAPGPTARVSRGGSSARLTEALPVGESAVLPWADQFGVLHVQVIVRVRNPTSAPMAIVPESVSYAVEADSGAVEMRGTFSVAIPAAIGPGGTAYLVDTTSAAVARRADLRRVSVEIAGRRTSGADAALQIDHVAVSQTPEGPEASGIVTNPGPATAHNVAVLVLLRDSHDRHLLGAVYDVAELPSLAAGNQAPFRSTYPGAPPLPPNASVTTEAVAAAEGP